MTVERIAGLVESDILRQRDRKVFLEHRHDAAFRAMDDRNRAAPIALPRHAPIAQPVGDCALAAAELFEPLADRAFCIGDGKAIEEAGIEGGAILDISGVADREMFWIFARRQDHRDDRQPIFAREIEIALVVRRTAEDRAGAVFHQDKIGDINRYAALLVERVNGFQGRAIAAFIGRLDNRFAGTEPVAFGDEFGELRVARGELLRQRVMRRQRDERGTEQCIGTGCENLDRLVAAGDRKLYPRAFGAADPVLLHQPYSLGPAVERLYRVEQFVTKRGDA